MLRFRASQPFVSHMEFNNLSSYGLAPYFSNSPCTCELGCHLDLTVDILASIKGYDHDQLSPLYSPPCIVPTINRGGVSEMETTWCVPHLVVSKTTKGPSKLGFCGLGHGFAGHAGAPPLRLHINCPFHIFHYVPAIMEVHVTLLPCQLKCGFHVTFTSSYEKNSNFPNFSKFSFF
jgi:hypothetical protein